MHVCQGSVYSKLYVVVVMVRLGGLNNSFFLKLSNFELELVIVSKGVCGLKIASDKFLEVFIS